MPKTLPLRPNLGQLKKQAKELLEAQKQGDLKACETLRRLRRFKDATDAEMANAAASLHEAQFALAMDYGFKSWNALKQHVLSTTPKEQTNMEDQEKKATIKIGGKTYKGREIKIEIDGETAELPLEDGEFEIEVFGDLASLNSAFSVKMEGNVGDNLNAGHDVICGNVGDSVTAGFNVQCRKVGDGVKAGGNIACGDVGDGVHAGGNVTCGNVGDNVHAGGNVQCMKAGGKIKGAGHELVELVKLAQGIAQDLKNSGIEPPHSH